MPVTPPITEYVWEAGGSLTSVEAEPLFPDGPPHETNIMKTKLHHFAYNIRPNTLELVLELFKKLDCHLDYREGDARWCIIAQDPNQLLQVIETNDKPISIKIKFNTHVGFLSDTPKKDIEEIKKWAEKKNLKFRQGSWSDRELWFDLPDLFVNFVIEIMHTSTTEE